MPLWRGYRRMLDSKAADLNNVSDGPHAGAITAALYLQEFVEPGIPWAHIDVMAWNARSRPGRPEGGEAQTLRALYAHIAGRFGSEASVGRMSEASSADSGHAGGMRCASPPYDRPKPSPAAGREKPARRPVRRG